MYETAGKFKGFKQHSCANVFTRLPSLSVNLRTSKHAVYKINSVDEKRLTNGFSSSAYISGSVGAMKTPKVPLDS